MPCSHMPRYHFSLEGGLNSVPADDSEDLPNDAAARLHAEDVAREISQGKPINTQSHILVTDEDGNGREVCRVYLLGRAPNNVL
jgi:hypothetical protein